MPDSEGNNNNNNNSTMKNTVNTSSSSASASRSGSGHPVTCVKSSKQAQLMSQTALRIKAVSQLKQVIRSAPNRGAIAYTLGRDLLLVLRYLPIGIFNKVTPTHFTSGGAADGSNHSNNNNNNNNNNRNNTNNSNGSSDNGTDYSFRVEENSTSNHNDNGDKNVNLPQSTSNSSSNSVSSQVADSSIFTEIFGRATFAALSMKDRVFKSSKNVAADFASSSSSSSSNVPSSNTLPKVDYSENAAMKQLNNNSSVPGPRKSKEELAKIRQEAENVDWGQGPEDQDMKMLIQDMNLEWKNIEARTRYLVSKMISMVDDPASRNLTHYIEDLYRHISQYRESRLTAVESGAIKSLLKVLKIHSENTSLVNASRECLGVLGYNPPLKGQGIKVLAIDGGGVRGLVAIEVLRMIEKKTGKRVHELFDFICGVSTGSILAFLIGAHRRTLDECEVLYKQLSQEIFNQNSFIGAGNLFWSHSYYNTAAWEKILKKHIGEHSLMTQARYPDLPRVAAISTLVNQERVSPYVFRTYSFTPGVRSRYTGGSRHEMWEAVRASAAAPTYFMEIKLGNNLHQDGGVLVNNPTSVALSEAKTIWHGQPLQCVMSLGTGQTFSSRNDPNLSDLSNPPNSKSPNSLSWKGKFLKVLDSATDTESVHYTMMELLPNDTYFRFNPHLSEMITMDEAKPERLEKLQRETTEYLTRNMDKVEHCCEVLTKEKQPLKRLYDWWSFKG